MGRPIIYAKFDSIPITKGYNKKTSIFWMYFLEIGVSFKVCTLSENENRLMIFRKKAAHFF